MDRTDQHHPLQEKKIIYFYQNQIVLVKKTFALTMEMDLYLENGNFHQAFGWVEIKLTRSR